MKLLERDLPARYATAGAALRELLACADSPRDGRELLVKLLADRFPHAAPMRQSELRLRGQRPGAMVAAVQPNGMDSIGAARAAQTATLPAGPHASRRAVSRRAPLIAAMVGGFVIAGVGAFLVVKTLKHSTATTTTTTAIAVAASTSQDARASAAASVPSDAAPTAVADAALAPPDAAPATKKEPASTGVHAVTDNRVGELHVNAFPVLTVYVDSHRVGDTPVDVTLAVGRHAVELVNTDLHHDEKLTITISEHQTTHIVRQ